MTFARIWQKLRQRLLEWACPDDAFDFGDDDD